MREEQLYFEEQWRPDEGEKWKQERNHSITRQFYVPERYLLHKGVMLCEVFTFQALKGHRVEHYTINNFWPSSFSGVMGEIHTGRDESLRDK